MSTSPTSISQEIRQAIRAARSASQTRPDDPFKQVLDEVARGLADDNVDARFTSAPAELAGILKNHVTTPAFLEGLDELAALVAQPVEGFLRVTPRTVSREDVMLVVPPDVQRDLAGSVDREIPLRLRVSDFRGAGALNVDARYTVFESAGYSVALTQHAVAEADGALRTVGRVNLPAAR